MVFVNFCKPQLHIFRLQFLKPKKEIMFSMTKLNWKTGSMLEKSHNLLKDVMPKMPLDWSCKAIFKKSF